MAVSFGTSYGSQVKEHLRNAIITGELQPGERINEVKLAEQLGISRTPLREAVSALASEGWIEQAPHKGARVAEFKLDTINELLEVRWILELGALNLVMDRPDWRTAVASLERSAKLTSEALEARTFYSKSGSDFHLTLLTESRNDTLLEMGLSVHNKLRAVRFRSGVAAERREAAVEEHEEIVAAMSRGDRESAKSALKSHLAHAAAQIQRP